VFGAGAFYMLRLMHKAPVLAEPGLDPGAPLRASGLMPGPVMDQESRR
jgi:cytochrome bd ubiquinol oxidase subunit I